ncbi:MULTISPECIES: hypothetical protein [unclassified Streptomyces]|uniref:hypothetical protein n=1 Tax=unclassified Streptomyces TaxID=2593676 RepID=UPI0004BD587E|nr:MULTISPECIES: hypothetical protein [unclassified Streptomyces]
MTFDKEWAELRSAAARRNAVQINSVTAEGSGGTADLVVHRDDLGAVGSDAYELRTKLSKDGDHARPATFDAAIALTGGNFASGAAVLKVHDRWQKQLKTLLDSCAHISNHLDYTKAQHVKDNVKIGGDLAAISALSTYMK